jgi:hypothetical protein
MGLEAVRLVEKMFSPVLKIAHITGRTYANPPLPRLLTNKVSLKTPNNGYKDLFIDVVA